jgi:putative membrane protein
MKNYKSLSIIAPLVISLLFTQYACMDNKKEDSKEVAEDKNDLKFESNENEKDAQFLVEAAAINREEISLGKLAQEKGNIRHVKQLGKMMEDDHTKALAELTTLAKTKNISLPTSQTEDGQVAYKKLNDKSGNDFGKEYCNMMVKGHKKAIELFEKASAECTDLDIRAWATATLPTLRTHLEHAIMCQEECAKM